MYCECARDGCAGVQHAHVGEAGGEPNHSNCEIRNRSNAGFVRGYGNLIGAIAFNAIISVTTGNDD
jgi:hypothetical protein